MVYLAPTPSSSSKKKSAMAMARSSLSKACAISLLVFATSAWAIEFPPPTSFPPLPPPPLPPPPPSPPIFPALTAEALTAYTAAAAAGWQIGSVIRGARASADSFADGTEIRDPKEGVKGGWFTSSVTAVAAAEGCCGSKVTTNVVASTLGIGNVDITFPVTVKGKFGYDGVGYGQGGLKQDTQHVSSALALALPQQPSSNTFLAAVTFRVDALNLVIPGPGGGSKASFSLDAYATTESLSGDIITPSSYFLHSTLFASGVSFEDGKITFSNDLLNSSLFSEPAMAPNGDITFFLLQPLTLTTSLEFAVPAGIDSFQFMTDLQGSASVHAESVPGPIAGAGLPGFLAACVGFLAWWRRRRQKIA
jgi:hypothetical protein